MKFDFIRKELLNHINLCVKSKYRTFDKAHNVSHFNYVTNNCVNYAKSLNNMGKNVSLEVAYVVGAYHDLGLIYGRENHAKNSGIFVMQDDVLKQFFDDETIKLIAEAAEDHSSHLSYEPRNIYGKIVADADRNNTLYLTFSRPVKYGLKHESHLNRLGQIERTYNFVNQKFGKNGYVKYWLSIPETKMYQQSIWNMLDNKEMCFGYIAGILDEVTKDKLK